MHAIGERLKSMWVILYGFYRLIKTSHKRLSPLSSISGSVNPPRFHMLHAIGVLF